MTDGTLEGETLTDGALRPPSLTATVTAVHAKLCGTRDRSEGGDTGRVRGKTGPTYAFVRFRRTGGELEDVGSLVPQTPAVQDLSIRLLEVVELQHVGGVQQSADRK